MDTIGFFPSVLYKAEGYLVILEVSEDFKREVRYDLNEIYHQLCQNVLESIINGVTRDTLTSNTSHHLI